MQHAWGWEPAGSDLAPTTQASCKHLGQRFNEEVDHIICVCAIGYKSGYIPIFIRTFNAQFYRRHPLSSLFFADPQFGEPLNLEAAPFNRFGRNFEICQWAPSSYNGQTTRCVAVTHGSDNGKSHLERFDFYEFIESRYYAPVALGIWIANWEMGCDALGIHGHLALLSPEERGIQNEKSLPVLPRYDLSWLPDKNF